MSNSIQTLLTCRWCMERIINPVLIPCGETICDRHEIEFRESEGRPPIPCKICNKVHKLGKAEHFPTNKIVQVILEKDIIKLGNGRLFSEAAQCVENLSESMKELESVKQHAEELIVDYFQTTRAKVDLAREQLIRKIDDCSERVMLDIDSYEGECRSNLVKLNEKFSSNEVTHIKTKLSEWQEKMERLIYDRELFKSIISEYKEHEDLLTNNIKALKQEVFLGKAQKLDFLGNMLDEIAKHPSLNRNAVVEIPHNSNDQTLLQLQVQQQQPQKPAQQLSPNIQNQPLPNQQLKPQMSPTITNAASHQSKPQQSFSFGSGPSHLNNYNPQLSPGHNQQQLLQLQPRHYYSDHNNNFIHSQPSFGPGGLELPQAPPSQLLIEQYYMNYLARQRSQALLAHPTGTHNGIYPAGTYQQLKQQQATVQTQTTPSQQQTNIQQVSPQTLAKQQQQSTTSANSIPQNTIRPPNLVASKSLPQSSVTSPYERERERKELRLTDPATKKTVTAAELAALQALKSSSTTNITNTKEKKETKQIKEEKETKETKQLKKEKETKETTQTTSSDDVSFATLLAKMADLSTPIKIPVTDATTKPAEQQSFAAVVAAQAPQAIEAEKLLVVDKETPVVLTAEQLQRMLLE